MIEYMEEKEEAKPEKEEKPKCSFCHLETEKLPCFLVVDGTEIRFCSKDCLKQYERYSGINGR